MISEERGREQSVFGFLVAVFRVERRTSTPLLVSIVLGIIPGGKGLYYIYTRKHADEIVYTLEGYTARGEGSARGEG